MVTALRGSGRQAQARALGYFWLTAVGLCGLELALFLDERVQPEWLIVTFVGVGLLHVAVGVLIWARRPSNRTGELLAVCGLALLVAALGNSTMSVLTGVGLIAAELPIGVLLHLLLAFPSGRLPDRWSRLFAAAGYALTIGLRAPLYLFGDGSVPGWLRIADRPAVVDAVTHVRSVAGLVVIVLISVVLGRRLRSARSAQRAVLASVWTYGVFTIVFLTVSANLAEVLHIDPIKLFIAQIGVFAGIPFAFALAILRGGFARTGEIEELGAWLGTAERNRTGLHEALAHTLGDPSLDLLFWVPDAARYVDSSGRAVDPRPRGRGTVEVTLAGNRIGAITYDRALIDDPELIRTAGRVVALAVEGERLTAALRSSEAALRESRTRIVTSADAERRRLAADLHDGLQGQLVVLALQAGQLARHTGSDPALRADAVDLRDRLQAAIADLRRLVHGVMPILLIQRGLCAAAEELLDHTPIRSHLDAHLDRRMPTAVESAGYYLLAEALANAVKHSCARELCVRLASIDHTLQIEVRDDGVGGACAERGAGLRGLGDRVDALGGRLRIDSNPGAGTRLLAEIPCEL